MTEAQTTTASADRLRAAVARESPRAAADLRDLVAIPSVSSLPDHADAVARGAERVAELFRDAGCPDVSVVSAGGKPAVIARFPGPADAPRICLYAHQDVQPAGDPDRWDTDPFTATERNGRLVGRGTGDDKGGVIAHLLALRAWDGEPSVGVTVLVEGEEEVGSPTLARLLTENHDALAADAYVIMDASNWAAGEPALTTTLRGIAELYVTVRTADRGLHSGIFGGVVPDALTSFCVLVSSLFDADGSVAVEGLGGTATETVDYPADRLAAETGKLASTRWIGHGSLAERLWTQPSLAVLAIDATPVAQASNTLSPSVTAKLSLRVPPGTDAQQAQAAVADHLRRHAPYGVTVDVEYGKTGEPWQADLSSPVARAMEASLEAAYGRAPVRMGAGGSIPVAAAFEAEFPAAEVVVAAVKDPTSSAHAPNESVDLGDLAHAALAEAFLFERLASPSDEPGRR